MVWNDLRWLDIPSLHGTINRKLHRLPLVSLKDLLLRPLLPWCDCYTASPFFMCLPSTSFRIPLKTKTLSLIKLHGLLDLKRALSLCIYHFHIWVEDKGTEITIGIKISQSFLPFIYFQLCISEHWNSEIILTQ